jgi:GlpG protein
MRQIATLPDGEAARRFADYLLTLKIDTRLEREPGGWALWVCDEDRVPQAREELAQFTRDPADPRYASAGSTADALRREEAKAEAEYRRRQVRLRERWGDPTRVYRPLTIALVVASVAVALATNLGDKTQPVVSALSISRYWKVEGGYEYFLGLREIRAGEVWRLVTPIFIHFGILHIVFNMLMLLDLGGRVESRRGSLRFLLLVLTIGIPSNLAEYFLDWEGLHLAYRPSPFFGGMSGVLYGLFGYIWMKSRYDPSLGLALYPNEVVIMMAWFVLCVIGFIGPIANVAHAAGLLAGLAIGYAPALWRSLRR